jgi:uncharacterized SAM-binding protein YcdF (DUF218 family)
VSIRNLLQLTISTLAMLLPAALPLAFVFSFALLHLGTWMIVSDALTPGLDYVFTYGGEDAREVYAAKILSEDPSVTWICSDNRRDRREFLGQKGVDTSRVIIVDTCTSTHSETEFLVSWLKGRAQGSRTGPVAVGLISGPYHMRRISLEISYHARYTDTRFYFLPVPLESYGHTAGTYRNWWKDRNMRPLILFELKKILYAGIIHHQLLPHKRSAIP